MPTVARVITTALGLSLLLGCGLGGKGKGKGKDGKETKGQSDGADGKGETKEEEKGPDFQVSDGSALADGPYPPEVSMAFFTVEGALQPLGCFDKDKKKILTGSKCLDMVPEAAEVHVSSVDSRAIKKVGARAEPVCTAGSGKKTAFAVEGISEGADFRFAVWPASTLKAVETVDKASLEPQNLLLDDDEKAKLGKGAPAGELQAHQIAELDYDGDGNTDKAYSVFIQHPKVPEQYLYSQLFIAPGGDLDKLILIEKSRTKRDVFEIVGMLDLDGDKTKELWLRLVFEEGGGDRLVSMTGGKPTALGKWSCGA